MNAILVVDDNPDDREYLTRSLRRNATIGHEVLEAQDETTCFEVLQSGRKIDCILLDYSLPGQDGLKVLSHILDQDPYASVVMVSGQGNEDVAVEAMKRGALDYFVKSAFPPSEMEKSVLEAIRRTSMARRIEDQRETLRTFADVMVHDMRAPWLAVCDSLARLAGTLPPEVARDHAEDLDIIRSGAEQVHSLVAALVDYTTRDGTEVQLEKVDLNIQVEIVQAALRAELQAANGRLICPDRLPDIIANGPQIAQLLKNLVRNGIQHNRSDIPTVRITARDHADRWSIDISDNGVGIDPGHQDLVFEPFRQVGPEGRSGGLGLAASRRIAERLGCMLTCNSLPGEGTSFTLTVPKDRGTSAPLGATSAQGTLSAVSRQFRTTPPEHG